ncbi:hypothetical protein XAC3810_1280016 [Xanthomonas citri pv. citri]|nr:hypothetical protein XAC3810_1280016 [Xanthomonas citri pv. citri]CEE25737.1 hypothetical protein XAC902_1560019 [Xanthomonas citri pv. citri]CEE56521.1 hypothetical protein XAC2852_1270019 [Xanthomonas citri pv. citri]CEE80122.1 hypothetical protein XACLE20_1940015 [Xanthomonas citri pv. citri]CEH50138.1 hypothetical protein XAC3615_14170011 [Xanthomonas citri pv. citri]
MGIVVPAWYLTFGDLPEIPYISTTYAPDRVRMVYGLRILRIKDHCALANRSPTRHSRRSTILLRNAPRHRHNPRADRCSGIDARLWLSSFFMANLQLTL